MYVCIFDLFLIGSCCSLIDLTLTYIVGISQLIPAVGLMDEYCLPED